jgi:hypothetical protein
MLCVESVMRYNFVIWLSIIRTFYIYLSGSKLDNFRSQNSSIREESYGNIDLEKYMTPRPLRPIVSNNYESRLLLMVFTTDVARAAAVEEIWPMCYLTFQVQSRNSTFIRFQNNNSKKDNVTFTTSCT